jgi:uncharacterized protein
MNAHQDFEINATIAQLFIYPIKSCSGIALQEALMTDTGLQFDRQWMVVDPAGVFVTQRELPRMCLVQPTLTASAMVLNAPGMQPLHLPLTAGGPPCRASVWGHDCAAFDMGEAAAGWLTDFLAPRLGIGVVAPAYRLVRFDPQQRRLSNKQWTGSIDAHNQFSDGYPILVLSHSAVDELNTRLAAQHHQPVTVQRFRANVVLADIQAHDEDRVDSLHIRTGEGAVDLALVKPCPRCPVPNVNPLTGVSSPEVGDALQAYRQDARVGRAVTFGMNAVVRQGFACRLRVGQAVGANYNF